MPLAIKQPRLRHRRLGLYGPFILLLIAVIAWSISWLWMRDQVYRGLMAFRSEMAQAGYDVTWRTQSVWGYPFRLDLSLSDVAIRRAPAGWRLSVPTAERRGGIPDAGSLGAGHPERCDADQQGRRSPAHPHQGAASQPVGHRRSSAQAVGGGARRHAHRSGDRESLFLLVGGERSICTRAPVPTTRARSISRSTRRTRRSPVCWAGSPTASRSP